MAAWQPAQPYWSAQTMPHSTGKEPLYVSKQPKYSKIRRRQLLVGIQARAAVARQPVKTKHTLICDHGSRVGRGT